MHRRESISGEWFAGRRGEDLPSRRDFSNWFHSTTYFLNSARSNFSGITCSFLTLDIQK